MILIKQRKILKKETRIKKLIKKILLKIKKVFKFIFTIGKIDRKEI